MSRARCVMLEVNTLPGPTPATCIFHQAAEAGVSPMVFLGKIILHEFLSYLRRRQRDLYQMILQQFVQNT